jgi:hypothetical protein
VANANPLSSMVLARVLLTTPSRPQRRFRLRRRPRRAEALVFLAEHYVASIDSGRLDALARDVAAASGGLRGKGTDVELLGILGLPSDESLMSLFAAPGLEAVKGTLARAGPGRSGRSSSVEGGGSSRIG